MKLNVGCGRMVLDGWTNIDIQKSPKAPREPEILSDVRSIPLEDECADVLMALHLIEHFYLWEADDVLQEWRRLLKPGGRLILELPNLEAACRNYLRLKKKKGQSNLAQMAMWPLYGDPSHEDVYMCHHWAYDPDTITELLEANGFEKVQILPPQTHGRRINRDMRVEALRS